MSPCQPKLAPPEAGGGGVVFRVTQMSGPMWKYGGNKRNTHLCTDGELLPAVLGCVPSYIPHAEASTTPDMFTVQETHHQIVQDLPRRVQTTQR